MTLIDTHIHIDHYANPLEIAQEYEKNKIYTLFVTNLPELFIKHHNSYSKFKYVRLCLGYHPQLALEYELNFDLFKKCASKTKYIGEVGLDFPEKVTDEEKEVQINAFKYITSKEFNNGKIYSIHSRGAEEQVLDILIENGVKHAIFHWYSGKISTLKKIVERGYYFSLNPKMLNSKKGYEIISNLPLHLILFETDGPFARLNRKIITPEMIKEIYEEFDKLLPNFEEVVFANFKRILIERDLYKY